MSWDVLVAGSSDRAEGEYPEAVLEPRKGGAFHIFRMLQSAHD